jgi:hypothetical protein
MPDVHDTFANFCAAKEITPPNPDAKHYEKTGCAVGGGSY